MRALSLARVLFTLLAFQLAVGLQMGVAQGAIEPASTLAVVARSAGTDASVMNDESAGRAACPMHDSSHASQPAKASRNEPSRPHDEPTTQGDEATAQHADPTAPHAEPAAPHDCCKSSGCQCHCGNLPLAFNVLALRGAPATALVQPSPATRSASAPSDTHFRPPIVS